MEVILLERIPKLGQMGDIVNVKPGYARNFLLPQGKALRATKANKEFFEKQRAQLEARNLEARKEAEAVAEKLEGQQFVAIRQAGESGQLYGSVTTRDIAQAVTAGGFSIERRQVTLNHPIKILGLHEVTIVLHPEVEVTIVMNVARSEDEAERQARGEDVTQITNDDLDEDNEAIAPEDVFEDQIVAEAALEELGHEINENELAASAETAEQTDTNDSENDKAANS